MSAPEVKEWSAGLESILAKEGEEAQSLFWLHNKAAREAQRRNDYINIPSIILQTVTGFMSATNGAVPPLALGALSIFTGILSTLLSYYRFSARAEGHRVVSQLYLKIYKNIEIELSLSPEQRIDPSKLLGDVRDKLARISEVAPDIPDNVINMYKAEFKENTTAKPIIANGLDKIEVYKEEFVVSPRPKVDIRRVEF
jgi:hypothetical protein